MEVPVLDMIGKQVETIELPADIFEVEVNMGLMHQAYVRQMANARLGTHKTKWRGEINLTPKPSGIAKKARAARVTVRESATHLCRRWCGAWSPPARLQQVTCRTRCAAALRSRLTALAADDQIVVVDRLALDTPKTRDMKRHPRQPGRAKNRRWCCSPSATTTSSAA